MNQRMYVREEAVCLSENIIIARLDSNSCVILRLLYLVPFPPVIYSPLSKLAVSGIN